MTSGLGGLAPFFRRFLPLLNGYTPFFQPFFGHFWPPVNGFYRLQVGGIAPISPVLARYKLHYFFLCHVVYSKKVATISHMNLMPANSYLLSYFLKDTILFIVTIIIIQKLFWKIIAAIKIVTISTRGILVFLHFDSMTIMLVGEFDFWRIALQFGFQPVVCFVRDNDGLQGWAF